MFILVKNQFTLEEMGQSQMLLKLNPDGKTFTIIKNRVSGRHNEIHHNSMLKHFILAVSPYPEREENDEETDRVSGS
jgi:hypothetical protein